MATKKSARVSIPNLYTEGMREVNKIMASGDATQRSVALQTLDDLTAMMLAHTLDTVQGKTALLTGLIAELTQVIDAIRVAPPYAQAVETIVAIVDKARVRLTAEKKNLLPPDA